MSSAELVRLAQAFEHFAESDCEDPLYVAICRHVARSEPILRLMLAAPPEQRRVNLLLAAIHHRLIEASLAGPLHALGAYYPSLGGNRPADDALVATLEAFIAQEREALIERLAHRATQTNEIGRCAVIRPALRELAAHAGQPRLALLDFGCSAGLNLGVDHWPIDYGESQLEGIAPAELPLPLLRCCLIGEGRPSQQQADPAIVSRLGIDLAPVDVQDDDAVRWLQACVWPNDPERRQRLDQAVAVARLERWPVRREADGLAAIDRWLDSLPADVLPVVINSWVLAYFSPASLARHGEGMLQRVRERGIAWLSGEAASIRFGEPAVPPPATGVGVLSDAEIAQGTLWTLAWRDTRGTPRCDTLARSHPHGRWLQWFGLVR